MKTVIITGVSRGLGEALALALLKLDYQLIGLGRTSNQQFAGHGNYRFIECDLSDPGIMDGIAILFSELAAVEYAQIVLINNAATASPVGVLGRLSYKEIQQSLQLNLVSPTQLANQFCRHFSKLECDKRIVNISSGAAVSPVSGNSIYCVAKAGLEMLTQSIAAETAYHGVTAMSIQPGVIDTEMQAWLRQQPEALLPTVGLYHGFHDRHQLLPAAIVAQNIVKSALSGAARNGQSFCHDQLC